MEAALEQLGLRAPFGDGDLEELVANNPALLVTPDSVRVNPQCGGNLARCQHLHPLESHDISFH